LPCAIHSARPVPVRRSVSYILLYA
jgi:hypothetical protein